MYTTLQCRVRSTANHQHEVHISFKPSWVTSSSLSISTTIVHNHWIQDPNKKLIRLQQIYRRLNKLNFL